LINLTTTRRRLFRQNHNDNLTTTKLLIVIALVTAFVKSPGKAAAEPAVAGKTNAPGFEVAGYLVEGNTVLPDEQLNAIFAKYTGPAIVIDQIRAALGELQLTYREYGFVTVGVTLPRQQVTNGIIRVQVTEGRLGEITVVGNRYFSSNNVRRALPGLTTNVLPNTKWLQPEIDRANTNPDRQIYPKILPGAIPGTSTLMLQVQDQLPLHGHLELNDKATPDTPRTRIDGALQYNNLWQLDHQIGLGYTFSPQAMKPDNQGLQFYDQPAVASYSGYYRIPLGAPSSLRQTYEHMPVNFGYDEATHRFNLPPVTGSPELIFYASRSTTDTGARFGPVSTVGTNTATLTVTSQDAEREPTSTANIGARYILPLPERRGIQSSFSAGFDFKSYRLQTILTNFTTVQEFSTNTPPALIYDSTVPEPTYSANSVVYAPLSAGWSGSRADALGTSSFGLNGSLYLAMLSSSDAHIQAVAGSARAGGNYATLNFNLGREQKLPWDWTLSARANGQWSSEPLISNEQFALGGVNSVRGYFEGDEQGDSGWSASLEARTPFFTTQVATIDDFVPTWLRGSVFVDYGQRYLLDPSPGVSRVRSLMGSGFGLSANINNHFEARINVAWPMFDSPNTHAGLPFVHFAFGAQF
jgi:hemolysin activation/secretion protein